MEVGHVAARLTCECGNVFEAQCNVCRDRYQDWRSYETWLVALWLDKDQGLYERALEFAESAPTASDWKVALREMICAEKGEGWPGGLPAGLLRSVLRESIVIGAGDRFPILRGELHQ